MLNPTLRTCMENIYIYLIPTEEVSDHQPSVTVYVSHLTGKNHPKSYVFIEDKVCTGYFTSD